MAKIAITYSLSEDLVQYIEDYKVTHKLKNRSSALERILLETKTKDEMFKIVLEELKNNLSVDNFEVNNVGMKLEEKVKKEIENKISDNADEQNSEEAFDLNDSSDEFNFMKNSINDIIFNMPDE